MKKLLPIVIITLTSLLITKEVWSLPNCSGNYWNNFMGVFTFELDHPNWPDATYSGEWKNGKRLRWFDDPAAPPSKLGL